MINLRRVFRLYRLEGHCSSREKEKNKMLLNVLSTTIRLQLGSAARAIAMISIAATLAGNVKADCVPTALAGYHIPFTMTAHRNDGLVSYTTGQLNPSASWFSQ